MENEIKKESLFKELAQINVNDYVEQKNGLNLLILGKCYTRNMQKTRLRI